MEDLWYIFLFLQKNKQKKMIIIKGFIDQNFQGQSSFLKAFEGLVGLSFPFDSYSPRHCFFVCLLFASLQNSPLPSFHFFF